MHSVNSLDDAIQILTWYTWRWIIEQIFRTMKNKGLKIEESQVQGNEKLFVLSTLCVATTIKVLALVEARDGRTTRKAIEIFEPNALPFFEILCQKLEGRTKKKKNKHKKHSLSWVSWIIARLGGWNGYASESPAGPITMLRGLQRFELKFEGWLLAQEDVCIG